jgi:hypothetical protein
VFFEDRPVGIPSPLQEPGRALDIGEDKRDDPGGELVHAPGRE